MLKIKHYIFIILLIFISSFSIVFAGGDFFPTNIDNEYLGARTSSHWLVRNGTYVEVTKPTGYDILIKGTNKYINFNTIVGVNGYGIRDNNGTIETKNNGGSWNELFSVSPYGDDFATGSIAYYNGSSWNATNTLYVDESSFIGIGTTTPDYNLHIDGSFKAERFINPYTNVVFVDKNGKGDFTTVGDACDYITAQGDASELNGYVVRVGPGEFVESEISCPGHTSVLGTGASETIIRTDSGVMFEVPNDGGSFATSFLLLKSSPTATSVEPILFNITGGGATHTFDLGFIDIQSADNGVTAKIMKAVGASSIEFIRHSADYVMTGSSVGIKNHNLINISSSTEIILLDIGYTVAINDVDDHVSLLNDDSDAQSVMANILGAIITTNASYTGTTTFSTHTGTNGTVIKQVKNSIFKTFDSGNGTSYCHIINSNNDSMEVIAAGVDCDSVGGNGYYAWIDTGDTFIHNFNSNNTGNLAFLGPGDENGTLNENGNLRIEQLRLVNQISNPTQVTDSTIHYAINSGGNNSDTRWLFHFDEIGTQTFTNDADGGTGFIASSSLVEQQGIVKKFGVGSVDFVPNDYMNITGTSTLNSDFAIDFWVRFDDSAGPVQPLISGGDESGSNYFQITKIVTRNIQWRIRQSNTNVISLITSGAPVMDDTWHNIRFEKTGNNYYAYFDGINQGVDSWIGTASNLTQDWRLGSNVPEGDSDYLEGYIDELLFTLNSDSNFNGSNYTVSQVPFDTSAPFYVLSDGTIAAAVNIFGGSQASSFWKKNGEGRLYYSVNELIRFLIPGQGVDLAANSIRSFMVGAKDFQAITDIDSAQSCSANGFWAIDCDTDGTGPDFGVQDDSQVLGDGYFGGTVFASSTNIEATTTIRGLDYLFPTTEAADRYLKTDGSGNLTWAIVSAGTIDRLADIVDVSTSTPTEEESALIWRNNAWRDVATSSLEVKAENIENGCKFSFGTIASSTFWGGFAGTTTIKFAIPINCNWYEWGCETDDSTIIIQPDDCGSNTWPPITCGTTKATTTIISNNSLNEGDDICFDLGNDGGVQGYLRIFGK